MSDVSKITIEGVTLNIKDKVARDNLETLGDDVDRLSGIAEENSIKLSRMTKPKYILITDSYGNRINDINFFEYFMQYSNTPPSDCIMYCNSGAGFTITHNSFLSLLKVKEQIVSDKSAITHIVVCGGSNDNNSNETDVRNAISEFCEYAKSKFPNANVYIGYIGWSWKPNENYQKTLAVYRDCNRYGAYYLNNIEFTLHRRDLITNKSETDYIHPNEQGIQMLGSNLAQCLKTGSCDVFYVYNQFVDTYSDTSKTIHFKGRIRTVLHNEIVQLSITEGVLGNSGMWQIDGSKQAFKEGETYVITDLSQYIPFTPQINYTNGTIVPFRFYSIEGAFGFGSIGFQNQKLVFRVLYTSKQITSNVSITIPAINSSFPTMTA